MEATKRCGSCQSVKSVNDCNRSTSSPDGLRWECKSCNVQIWKKWRINNRDCVNEQYRNKYATNQQVKVDRNMHDRLRNTLRKGIYTLRTAEIIGLSEVQWLDWLVFNFEGDMWFQNYGSLWEFNLVIPASAFDLTIDAQLLTAFNWRNIRPCLKSDNLAKYNFILPFAHANQSIRV